MNASALKRFFAYLIDSIIVFIIFIGFSSFLPIQPETTKLNQALTELNEKMLKKEYTFTDYIQEYSSTVYQMDKINRTQTVLNVVIILIYFVLIPMLWTGKTMGKQIFHLKIESQTKPKPTIWNYLVRACIMNGILYLTLVLFLNLWIKPNLYFQIVSILTFFQILVVILSGFMVLYRQEHLGLQDIVTKTKVISC